MRNKILYISTENLNFFYRTNKELSRLNIKFEILNVRDKVPNLPCLILTTSEEIHRFGNSYKKAKIISYSYEENFQHYILKVLAAFKIGYKDFYSELMFSIDPGSKQIGIAIFLEDLFLISHTLYDKDKFLEFINDKINCFQQSNPNLINLIFKFGSGVLTLTIELLRRIFNTFGGQKNLKVYLIDESKSSKTKIKDKNRRIRTKHELSALILSLRKGIEVKETNYLKIFKQFKLKDSNYIKENNRFLKEFNDEISNFQELIDKILNNEISIRKSYEILHK
ncbi:MAG: hypothetical protein ACFE9Q_03120 [Candidatus Hodarchaeota archaeon]